MEKIKNYSENDKEILITLVEEFTDIIENKKTDAITTKLKEETWDEICIRFNEDSEIKRTAQSLRNCWGNIKKRCRKSMACEGSIESKLNYEERVKDILSISFDGLRNPYDSDSLYNEDLLERIKQEIPKKKIGCPSSSKDDWKIWAPKLLKKYMNYPIKRKLPSSSPSMPGISNQADDTISENGSIKRPKLSEDFPETYFGKKEKLMDATVKQQMLDEERKKEIHELDVEEKKLKIEFLKLELLNAEAKMFEEERRKEIHELDIEQKKLKIECLRVELMNAAVKQQMLDVEKEKEIRKLDAEEKKLRLEYLKSKIEDFKNK